MAPASTSLLFWAPRALCILFALFLSIFAADVFEDTSGFRTTAVALLLHLLPTFLVLLVLALAWRHELAGGILFVLLGVLYVVLTLGRMHWSAPGAISGPLFVIGALFIINSFAGRAGVEE